MFLEWNSTGQGDLILTLHMDIEGPMHPRFCTLHMVMGESFPLSHFQLTYYNQSSKQNN